jgi:hypothetical protein
MVHSEWKIVFYAGVLPSPFFGEGLGVRSKSGFEQRGELLRAFQKVLQNGGGDRA